MKAKTSSVLADSKSSSREEPVLLGGVAAHLVEHLAQSQGEARAGDLVRVSGRQQRLEAVEFGEERRSLRDGVVTGQLGDEVFGERGGGRVVEDQRGGQPQPGRGRQVVTEFQRRQRVDAQLAELLADVDGLR